MTRLRAHHLVVMLHSTPPQALWTAKLRSLHQHAVPPRALCFAARSRTLRGVSHEYDPANPIECNGAHVVSVLPIRQGLHDDQIGRQRGVLAMQRMRADLESVTATASSLRLDAVTVASRLSHPISIA